MTWDALFGHSMIVRSLQSAIAKGKVFHAYAFVGARGIGKATAARIFAQALMCEAAAGPCGECRTCRRIGRLIHPDVHWVAPESDSIGIEQVRELQATLSLKPFEAARKVAVIDDGESMTTAAQNCLLKVLEEPPGDAVIVVVASNPSALLPTIRSRCQMVRFQPLSKEEVAHHLRENGVEEAQADLLASVSEGRLGAALAAVESDLVALRDEVSHWVAQLHPERTGLRAVVRIASLLEENKERVNDYLNLFLLWLRDIVLVREGVQQAIANQDAVTRLEEQAGLFDTSAVAKAMQEVERARRRLRGNANLRLTMDVMLSNVQRSLIS